MKALKSENIIVGYLYFFVHFVTEVISFYTLSKLIGDSIVLWLAPLIFDMVAFVPQAIVGYINDLHPKINFGVIGLITLCIGLLVFSVTKYLYLGIIILSIGNEFTHVAGAETTLRVSKGKMTHPALFVAGGSFGIIIGKLLARANIHYIFVILLTLCAIPFSILADTYKDETLKDENPCKNFNYQNKKVKPMLIILFATFVVIVRGYMGYGIPTTWNKTIIQTICLYFIMGTGKALGGILVDTIGMKKTAILSTIFALPFLLLGDNVMLISIIGVMFFSMTMAVTLGLLVSVLKKTPGLAFGFTTIGLFLGTVPMFFIRLTNPIVNTSVLVSFTLISVICLNYIIKGDKDESNSK